MGRPRDRQAVFDVRVIEPDETARQRGGVRGQRHGGDNRQRGDHPAALEPRPKEHVVP